MLKDFSISGREYVELKNLLKLLNYVNSGGEAKVIIQNGEILVNDEVELRRGRKLKPGDIVKINEDQIKIVE
ncbi:RNA-binding S4 domain-containing protein [Portibacter lacus]|uniref:RNA-binding protein n=1 Tax=Portibacter lacus TaxID=1099794 RepID=A0AA37SVG6_9BACT|nr:RNA-binding S4 domain-containing protein [Portibacter lacus]GLR20005.1 hypothetical protein GCM10007940_46210 [Portibacter lacus]